ncbi:MAG: hypothetical protein LW854_23565, partial [Rubrivivax sp.]|nr:hypothetical protein [Rubrivivax sp.]
AISAGVNNGSRDTQGFGDNAAARIEIDSSLASERFWKASAKSISEAIKLALVNTASKYETARAS